MGIMRIAGILLIALGIVGLLYGAVTYSRNRETVDIGPIHATVQKRQTSPVLPVAGGIALVLGVGLLVAGGKRPV